MAVNDSLYQYYLHQFYNSKNYLEQCMVHAEPEVVHQLRLCIKKLRAFNKLAKQLGLEKHEEYAHMTLHLRKMFKLAGQIRDTQVQLHLLAEREKISGTAHPEFRNWLTRREKKRIARLCDSSRKVVHLSDDIFDTEKSDDIIHSNDESILKNADKVLDDLFVKTQKLAEGNISEPNLHQVRKITKQMRYILNILHCSFPDFTYKTLSIAAIKEMETAIGHWHDNVIRVELLGRFIMKMKESENTELWKYQQLASECSFEMNDLYNKACEIAKEKLF